MKSILQKDRECFLCGTFIDLDCHHVFPGIRRTLSELHGLKVWLCHSCHMFLHDKNSEAMRELQAWAQLVWMEANHKTAEDFIRLFGKGAAQCDASVAMLSPIELGFSGSKPEILPAAKTPKFRRATESRFQKQRR